MHWLRLSSWVALGGLLVASATSCRTATEITLTIRTNVPCAEVEGWRGVAVYVGKAGAESQEQAPTLVTTRCEREGEIGSLVVVPSGAKDELVGVRVVAGISRRPEECLANGYEGGCIVSRRAIRFTPHTDLALDVDLLRNCLDIGCDPQNTCVAGSCRPTTDEAAPIPTVEPFPAGAPSVRCGDDAVFCATSGNVCCLTVDVEAQKTHGDCRPAGRCRDIVLHCDDDTDCPRAGEGGPLAGICVVSYAQSDAAPYSPLEIAHANCRAALLGNGGLERPMSLALCEERKPCADSQFDCWPSSMDSQLLPGYNWCHVVF